MKTDLDKIAVSSFAFIKMIEKLAIEKRNCLLSNGQRETVSDHIFKFSVLMMIASPHLKNKIDLLKVLKLILAHDLVEFDEGDVPLHNQLDNNNVKLDKFQKEQNAIKKLCAVLPPPMNTELKALWFEYEDAKTLEARLAKDFDYIEASLQGNIYHDVSYWAKDPKGIKLYDHLLNRQSYCPEEPLVGSFIALIKKVSEENMTKIGLDVPSLKEKFSPKIGR